MAMLFLLFPVQGISIFCAGCPRLPEAGRCDGGHVQHARTPQMWPQRRPRSHVGSGHRREKPSCESITFIVSCFPALGARPKDQCFLTK